MWEYPFVVPRLMNLPLADPLASASRSLNDLVGFQTTWRSRTSGERADSLVAAILSGRQPHLANIALGSKPRPSFRAWLLRRMQESKGKARLDDEWEYAGC